MRGVVFGAGAGLVFAKFNGSKNFGTPVTVGALLGGLGASYLHGQSNVGQSPTAVGWSQPPRPADVTPSFDPRASKRDQARAVLYDYYHDDPLRYWSDHEAVKKAFIGGRDPRKEDHDPLLLIQAYENPNHKVWKGHKGGDSGGGLIGDLGRVVGLTSMFGGDEGMSWKEMDRAVKAAIAHRTKLGPLPRSTYDKYPLVIYYYDNDKMKRISYPGEAIPPALNSGNNRWWSWGNGVGDDAHKAAGTDDVHIRETDNPKKIAVERENPGWVSKAQKQQLKTKYPWLSDMDSGSAGDWSNTGFQWDKDLAGTGALAGIVAAMLAAASVVLDVTGVGAVVGVPLSIATPFIVAAVAAADTALHAGDFGAALANLGPALLNASAQALTKEGVSIPPAAVQALGGAVKSIANDVQAGQKKHVDFGKMWADVAAKAASYTKIGDGEAEAIAHMIGGGGGPAGPVGRVFIEGYLGGKYLDAAGMSGIAKILQGYATFADPRLINIALLGMGIGKISAQQASASPAMHARHTRQAQIGYPATHHASGWPRQGYAVGDPGGWYDWE